jgi:hypothetical protein
MFLIMYWYQKKRAYIIILAEFQQRLTMQKIKIKIKISKIKSFKIYGKCYQIKPITKLNK